MQRTNIYLEDEQCAALDAVAAREGTSRAAVIRRLIDRALGDGEDDLEADLSAIRDSFGTMSEVESLDRSPDARSAHLDRMRRQAG